MSSFPGSPRLIRAAASCCSTHSRRRCQRVIILQYNPDTLTRTLQAQGDGRRGRRPARGAAAQGAAGRDDQARGRDRRHRPARAAGRTRTRASSGIHPQLAALETLIYPAERTCCSNQRAGQPGTLEIAPAEAPLTLFVWSKRADRAGAASPSSAITEEAFDPQPQPDPGQGQPRACGCSRQRPGVRSPGQQHVPRLPAAQGAAGRRAPRAGRWPPSASAGCAVSGDPGPVQQLSNAGCRQPPSQLRDSRYYGLRRMLSHAGRRARSPTCARRFVPQPDTSPLLQHTGS